MKNLGISALLAITVLSSCQKENIEPVAMIQNSKGILDVRTATDTTSGKPLEEQDIHLVNQEHFIEE
ncbi:hypothetical protein [Dyadobacter diqingensis]|uniref:hypothetical protein n=1 Tax=Dyadobacter diqingensis TaxID=2938121 RepID=UPI0020C29155|nr:hypothetical protein [Dyadobacter diqingensis]